MWPFKKKETEENKPSCKHDFVITQCNQVTKVMSRFYDTEEIKTTVVSRICRQCLVQEAHTVPGHIDYSKALNIFGGTR
ncbi:hypothetical protein A71_146 [Escherichia phage A7_1]|uniref:Uncharacterized protein n=2 Tax=Vequintavirinae TaxID=1911928 RepID=A0AAE9VY12_9CAUD|nr:hypothetical protein A71_146 [Escherichia phage A7_1]UZZ64225.1 hypothetical protein A54_261 [Escherichia phage A5-4]WBF77582.1 hypothetical protein A73_108 [Escherichia phage A73]WBF77846.1 hypothetical protein W70_94 [Escherichia phage W70]